MTIWSCYTCGVEHPDSAEPPATCQICTDERQYVPATGQRWTTQAELSTQGYKGLVGEMEKDLYALTTEPRLAIGQRGLLVRTTAGNLLWEPPGFIDDHLIDEIRTLGGVAAISASHPHLTGASIQWSHAFGGAPVFVAESDRRWIQRPDEAIVLWSEAVDVLPGLRFLQCGGHFAGSSVAHWTSDTQRVGALLTGDTIGIGANRKSANVMRSFPNYIPLPERAVRRILKTVQPCVYDRLYSAFTQIDTGAKGIVDASLNRYIDWLRGDVSDDM